MKRYSFGPFRIIREPLYFVFSACDFTYMWQGAPGRPFSTWHAHVELGDRRVEYCSRAASEYMRMFNILNEPHKRLQYVRYP